MVPALAKPLGKKLAEQSGVVDTASVGTASVIVGGVVPDPAVILQVVHRPDLVAEDPHDGDLPAAAVVNRAGIGQQAGEDLVGVAVHEGDVAHDREVRRDVGQTTRNRDSTALPLKSPSIGKGCFHRKRAGETEIAAVCRHVPKDEASTSLYFK